MRAFFWRVLLPLIFWFLLAAFSSTFIPESYAALRPLPAILLGIVLLYWWLTSLARWLVRRWRWVTVGYLLTNLATALTLMNVFLAASFALNAYDKNLAGIFGLVGLIAGPGWLVWSIVHLLRHGRRHKNSIWWLLLAAWLEQVDEDVKPAPAKTQPARRQRRAETQRTKPPAAANRSAGQNAPASSKPTSKPLYTPVGAGGERATQPGAAIPPRGTARLVGNDAQDFVQQAQAWARRQETAGQYVPFE